ncbi:hypothetical protein J3998_07245 [Thiomicrorhabdus sp. 6S2-11]|uniref:Tyr recombinase domain-containing protein n=1 Tax=Thiomicrorhabdus marina TaxID=2818442 RepID=A0ABS3Q4V7_9GAMM|nr:hypothetical protein [Thiomicrorhabdus marina]MBO1927372.1 hypothetical protein [Thiomicrorhabdus marina]
MPYATHVPHLLNNTSLAESLESKLSALNPLDNTFFNDDIWRFQTAKQVVTIDFTIFTSPYLQFTESITISFDEQTTQITLVEFAKLVWLEITMGKAALRKAYSQAFDMLALVMAYLYSEGIDQLDTSHLEGFYSTCLMQNPTRKGLTPRLSSPAYSNRFEPLNLNAFRRILAKYKISGVIGHVTSKQCDKALNDACIAMLDMTRLEYRKGGSFNYLGLEVGKHYIDHCQHLFEGHCAYVTAIKRATMALYDMQSQNSDLKLQKQTTTKLLGQVFIGAQLESSDIKERFFKSVSLEKLLAIEAFVHKTFKQKFERVERCNNAFKLDTINQIVSACHLPERYDAQEFVRALLFVEFFGDNGKTKSAIWEEYKAAISSVKSDSNDSPLSITLAEFDEITKNILDERRTSFADTTQEMRQRLKYLTETLPIPPSEHYLSGMEYFNKMCNMVEDAGVTCFVGLTGWRASEYAFSLNDIEIDVNSDVLDNQYTPWRFHVRWKVPKTSGDTPLPREITLGAYILAAQSAHLNLAEDKSLSLPALYFSKTDKQKADSQLKISTAVNTCWEDFVHHYSMFQDIDTIQVLSEKNHLNEQERGQYDSLISTYDMNSSHIRRLRELRQSLKAELPRVLLAIELGGGKYFGKRLRQYVEGTAPEEITDLFDSHLSKQTKATLMAGEISLDKAGVRSVRSEFLGKASYPTPHAFRHIFAEAVLRRYRGDVGKFIRAHFKHLDSRFFMAYLRDKEFRVIQQVATRNVINAVVRIHIDAIEDKHRDYAGGFDRFLSKAVNITHVIGINEMKEELANATSKRVLAMKSNPWATCFLRDGTQQTAKCSINGEPQRQNASPKLCLGCINADITEGNFNGIVIYIKDDIDACRNPELPWFIKEPCYHTVRLALKRIEELKRNSGKASYDKFIAHLQDTVLMAEAQRGYAE